LRGVVVSRAARRRGLGRKLTTARLAWIARHADDAYYCVSRENLASIKLHETFGFTELTRDFWFPKLNFSRHGGGALYVLRAIAAR
jgi:ribosomal protein S18 acetylase RimI-like enzyme